MIPYSNLEKNTRTKEQVPNNTMDPRPHSSRELYWMEALSINLSLTLKELALIFEMNRHERMLQFSSFDFYKYDGSSLRKTGLIMLELTRTTGRI